MLDVERFWGIWVRQQLVFLKYANSASAASWHVYLLGPRYYLVDRNEFPEDFDFDRVLGFFFEKQFRLQSFMELQCVSQSIRKGSIVSEHCLC